MSDQGLRTQALCLCCWLLCLESVDCAVGPELGRKDVRPPERFCDEIPTQVIAAANLTTQEAVLLPDLCWNGALAHGMLDSEGLTTVSARNGIPPGVVCEKTLWCDKYRDTGICSEVCKPGTVKVDEWLWNAIKTQIRLTNQLPFCYTQLSGTHNSAITLANGYGNRDLYFQKYLKFLKHMDHHATIETNNQWLSLTDQLILGVRLLELDVHWVKDELRIAHCGGFHSESIDHLVKVLNVLSKLLGNKIQWDSETLGCQPSMSSIEVEDQRSFKDALHEISEWTKRDENNDEFVVIYLDSQMDIKNWGKLGLLMDTVLEEFPKDLIFTPMDREMLFDRQPFPSPAQILSHGKRVMFIVSADWGGDSWKLIFNSDYVCDWSEPGLRSVLTSPYCSCVVEKKGKPCKPTMAGQAFRVETCELHYGVLNCGGRPSESNWPILDKATLPHAFDCGINFPSPDRLTPDRAAATVWSWAPGNPPTKHWMAQVNNGSMCVYISSADGRWRVDQCTSAIPVACRKLGESLRWSWALETSKSSGCPAGYVAGAPRHALENNALQDMLSRDGILSARLVITDWHPSHDPYSSLRLRDKSTVDSALAREVAV